MSDSLALQVNDIQKDTRLTPRGGIDPSTVGIYAASFDQLPPIDVFWIEGRDGWWVVDGWHRLAAAESLERESIQAVTRQGTFEDALEFSYDANLRHGKPLTLSERKDGAKLKLRRHTERSNNWIAQDCGLTAPTIIAMRDELEEATDPTLKILKLTELLGRDGKWRPRAMPKEEELEPEPIETVKLYKGDMRLVLGKLNRKFGLVVADPPYGVTDFDWDVLETKSWLEAIMPTLKNKYHLFWFCAPKYAADVEMVFRELGLEIQSRVIWHRRNMAKGSHAKNRFIDTWEMIFHVGNKPLNFPDGWADAWFDVQVYAVPQSNFADKKLHPTQKPYALIRRLVEFGSDGEESILDPFAGGGTTGAACQEDDRQCVLIEREEGYCGIIEGRLGIRREKGA